MRIIGGTHRSRLIQPPKDDRTTRPITDRVKQAMFDRLVTMEALGGNAVDIFAGTGSLGLEALSRGTDHVAFVERDRRVRDILKQNIDTLGFAPASAMLSVDALSPAWLQVLPKRPIRLVFLDPPYAMFDEPKDVARISALITALFPVMEDEGVLVLRTEEHATPPDVAGSGWSGPETHEYGSMHLHFYTKPAAAPASFHAG